MSPGAINKRRRGREAGTRGRLPDGDPCCSPKRVAGPPRPRRKPKLTTVLQRMYTNPREAYIEHSEEINSGARYRKRPPNTGEEERRLMTQESHSPIGHNGVVDRN
ncbi:hypothetical protein NDU88_007823 [Pleurodeles waltl]|uniref:Uncharacterized protein n=1 Tax=Pleurodeles waltl TaxID=8319 RepID=A0AAV7VTR8_PLEWA|nr:hypothetical protein NDU88_007823 [Pleurodeles waltl]